MKSVLLSGIVFALFIYGCVHRINDLENQYGAIIKFSDYSFYLPQNKYWALNNQNNNFQSAIIIKNKYEHKGEISISDLHFTKNEESEVFSRHNIFDGYEGYLEIFQNPIPQNIIKQPNPKIINNYFADHLSYCVKNKLIGDVLSIREMDGSFDNNLAFKFVNLESDITFKNLIIAVGVINSDSKKLIIVTKLWSKESSESDVDYLRKLFLSIH